VESNGVGRPKPCLNGAFYEQFGAERAISLRFQTAQPFRIALKWLALCSLSWTSDCYTVEPKLRLLVNQERARETSSPPKGASNRVSACANARSFVGYDGGDAARYPLAS
jgi:hypothetical protein